MKRCIQLMLMVSPVVLLLTACGGSGSPSVSSPPASVSSVAPSPTVAEDYSFPVSTADGYSATFVTQPASAVTAPGKPGMLVVTAQPSESMQLTNTTKNRTMVLSGAFTTVTQWKLPPDIAKAYKAANPGTGFGDPFPDTNSMFIAVSSSSQASGTESASGVELGIDETVDMIPAASSLTGTVAGVTGMGSGTGLPILSQFPETMEERLDALLEETPSIVYVSSTAVSMGGSDVDLLCYIRLNSQVEILGVSTNSAAPNLTYAQAHKAPGQPCFSPDAHPGT